MTKQKGFICDLDGTVAICHPGRNIYDATTSDVDLPNKPVIEVAHALILRGYDPVFVSGREDKFRTPTTMFLREHFTPYEWNLFMRKTGDTRNDAIVKEEIYRNQIEFRWDILLCLDDRDRVVKKWREMGLTCLQVCDGNY